MQEHGICISKYPQSARQLSSYAHYPLNCFFKLNLPNKYICVSLLGVNSFTKDDRKWLLILFCNFHLFYCLFWLACMAIGFEAT